MLWALMTHQVVMVIILPDIRCTQGSVRRLKSDQECMACKRASASFSYRVDAGHETRENLCFPAI